MKSTFDPLRDTVGTIYRNAQMFGEKGIVVGDSNYEIKKGLVEDINNAISEASKHFSPRPFYLAIYEKYDLMMKKGIVRIPKATKYRPYPEQDTMVFHIYPSSNKVFHCWTLPHRSEMLNQLMNWSLYPADQINLYRHWEDMRLEHFGFMKNDEGNWVENPHFKGDQDISIHPDRDITLSMCPT